VYLKNMPIGLMLRLALQRLLYEVGAGIYFARLGWGAAFLRGKLDVIRHVPTLWRKRREIQKAKTVGNERMLALMQPGFAAKWRKLRSSWE
jgi:hypothetical protein